jgi:hypothetical protein
VIPDEAPVRQWVLSLPYRVRFVCAHDPAALAAVRRILVRAIAGYYERTAARLGKPRPRAGAVAFVQRFDFDGFSLHGAVRVAAGDRKRLEHLCRYAGRPAIAESRLSLRPDGRVAYALKKTWRDGSTHVVMEPQVLIERLLALVPRPRRHLVTYHGVLAPGASMRDLVVPQVDEDGDQEGVDEGVANEEEARSDEVASASVGQRVARVPHRPGKRRRGVRRYYTWAELLRRVFGVEVFSCPNCGGKRRLLAAIQDPDSIQRVLRSLGFSGEVPELAPARAPPGGEGWFGA